MNFPVCPKRLIRNHLTGLVIGVAMVVLPGAVKLVVPMEEVAAVVVVVVVVGNPVMEMVMTQQ